MTEEKRKLLTKLEEEEQEVRVSQLFNTLLFTQQQQEEKEEQEVRVSELFNTLLFTQQEVLTMNLEELDQLVENYLKFRNFGRTASVLSEERKGEYVNKELEDRNDVIERIMKSLEKCDSLRLLTLWDTYVIQVLERHSPDMVAEARITEFYIHLYCATYPFRGEVLETANSPNVAAKYAARSMTIFKHFLEQRGRILLKMPEFTGLKNLHKIAFPPTHPSFSYLFRPDWVTKTLDRIRKFLIEFHKPPKLYTDMSSVQNIGKLEAREVEIKRLYQQREDKFLQFSRSIYEISHDLISTLDEGKSVDKDFLRNFKAKFEEFRSVLDAAGVGNESQLAAANVGGGEVVRKRRKKKRRDSKHSHAPSLPDLSFTVIIQDIQAMVSEVEVELNSLTKSDRRMTSIDAEVALQSAMQVCSIFNALNDLLIPSTDPNVEKNVLKDNRRTSAYILFDNDVFQLQDKQTEESSRGSYPSLIMKAFSSSFVALSSYVAKTSAGSPKERTFSTGDISNTYGILFTSSCATVYNMCRLFGSMVSCLTPIEFVFSMKEDCGVACHQFFAGLCDAVSKIPVECDGSLENLKVVFLALIAMFSHDTKFKRVLVKNGNIDWISKQLEEHSNSSTSNLLSNRTIALCMLVVCSILEDIESQRAVAASVSLIKACVSIVRVVARSLSNDTDIEECLHVACLRILCILLNEKEIRDTIMNEIDTVIAPLKIRVQANLSLNPAAEEFTLSEAILKAMEQESDNQSAELAVEKGRECIVLAEDFFFNLMVHLPDEENTMEYKNLHPKDCGVKLLGHYTKSYIAEHGSLYDETESYGEF